VVFDLRRSDCLQCNISSRLTGDQSIQGGEDESVVIDNRSVPLRVCPEGSRTAKSGPTGIHNRELKYHYLTHPLKLY